MTVIGVGAQNDLEYALDFMKLYDGEAPFDMLWDPTFDSWRELRINGQPQGRLLTAAGEIIASWAGAMPEQSILDAVAAL